MSGVNATVVVLFVLSVSIVVGLGLFVIAVVLRAKARAFDLGLDDAEEPAEEDDGKFETSETDRGKATPAARVSDEESAI